MSLSNGAARAFELPRLHDVVRTGTVLRYPLGAHRDAFRLFKASVLCAS